MNAKSVTLEEFLANDYEYYEYIKGDLVPMGDPTMEHGELSSNLVILLGTYIRQHQLGRIYTAETTFQIGQGGRKPYVAFIHRTGSPKTDVKPVLSRQILPLKLFHQLIRPTRFKKRYRNTSTLVPRWFGLLNLF